MPKEWEEGWYRVKGKHGTTVGHYVGPQRSQLSRYEEGGNVVEKILLVTDDELAAMIVDAVQAHLKYLETGEFEI